MSKTKGIIEESTKFKRMIYFSERRRQKLEMSLTNYYLVK